MASTINFLKLLADPTRLRLLLLLEEDELSVAELQKILGMGQSRISSHLAQLKRAGVVEDRRSGKNVYYGLTAKQERNAARAKVSELIRVLAREMPETARDRTALQLALRKRRDARFSSAHEMAQALERFAFSNEGFSPLQVASYMKGLFAAEFLQWRKTATAALDMEVDRGERRPRIETPGAEPPTQGPTMALRPGLSTSGVRAASEVKSQTARSRGAISQAVQTMPSSPSSPRSARCPRSCRCAPWSR